MQGLFLIFFGTGIDTDRIMLFHNSRRLPQIHRLKSEICESVAKLFYGKKSPINSVEEAKEREKFDHHHIMVYIRSCSCSMHSFVYFVKNQFDLHIQKK